MGIFSKVAGVGLAVMMGLAPAIGDGLTEEEQKIMDAVDAAFDDQLSFLTETINISSGTRNLEGVRKVGVVMDKAYSELGFQTRWIDMPEEMNRAGHLAGKLDLGDGPKIMLIGHLDTVFPKDSPFQTATRRGERIYGPGASDMKGGNAVLLYALKALKASGNLDQGTLQVILTGDEESTGKPLSVSRKDMIDMAKESDIALNFEGGALSTAVIGRRGSSGWALEVTGRRAHSSAIFSDQVGAGAIFEASRIIHKFYEEVRKIPGLTFNPGVIAGGTKVEEGENQSYQSAFGKSNVVASKVVVNGGLRFLSEEDKEKARDIMRKIVAENLPHTSATVTFTDSYPAMTATPANEELLAIFSQVNQDLGLGEVTAFPPERRGAADISFVAPYVPASMDGLGAFGGSSHTEDEWTDIEGLRLTTKRTALYLHRLLSAQ
ncbi:peptidase M20 [Kordiimonas sediminis]|uniref:Peptidase M20 n=1 Tax=Kordiimonas sediminis TaxID=1735581 RepID=A0A919AQ93_9PROT|nr:M20/M25/M40 family metallo-hydrolase [Kordiimonas sediminis]GHF18981.1 peptidase M20 [Kordiimonas sediminis]